jgi:hypothetical protein
MRVHFLVYFFLANIKKKVLHLQLSYIYSFT